ncbi:unnamed protein product [Urochloa humidicola]
MGGGYPAALLIHRTTASLYATDGNGGGGGSDSGGGGGREDAWSKGAASALVDAWGRDPLRLAATASTTPAVAGGPRAGPVGVGAPARRGCLLRREGVHGAASHAPLRPGFQGRHGREEGD